jgi:predicted nucleotidyltransferase
MNPVTESFRSLLKAELPALTAKFRVDALALFGSRVRRDERLESDLDVLVSFHETPSLFQLVDLETHLSDLLGVKVDVVLRDALKPRIGKRILAEMAPV